MEELFSKVAPAYWAKGISVIPLKPLTKRPSIDGWATYSKELPSRFNQEQWLTYNKTSNIGVVLGQQSNLVFIDIDSEDPAIEKAILSVIPKSPWKRVGKKGCIYAYKYNGETARKISAKNIPGHLVEILSNGNQGVLPPSIHPDTLLPYQENVPLLDVYDDLPNLPEGVHDRLRAALSQVCELTSGSGSSAMDCTAFVAVGQRDSLMTSLAGNLAWGIIRGDETVVGALTEMRDWCDTRLTEKDGDKIDFRKGMAKVVEFLKRDVAKGKILPPSWDAELTPEQKIEFGLDFDEDKEEWTCVRINDYIMTEISKTTGLNDPQRQEIVKTVLEKIAKSKHLREMEIGQILTNLRKNDGLKLPLSFYTKELKNLKSGPIEGNNHTEIAKETIKVWEERYGPLRFFMDQFWMWESSYWKPVPDAEVWKVVLNEFGALAAAKKASDHSGIIKIMKQDLPSKLTESEAEGINFMNGFLTKDMRLVPHQPEHGKSYKLPYQYKPDIAGKCPLFFSYLQDSWGDHADFQDKVKALREAIAVTLFGMATSYQRAFLLMGPGGSGKSVILKIVEELVPEEAKCGLPPEQWGSDFAASRFVGKLLNIAGELDKDKYIPSAIFKTVVVGDKMDVRFLYHDLFRFEPKCAHWFAGNDTPKTRDGSNGFNRRWLIFMFNKIVDEKYKIKNLEKLIIENEMEAIVAWAIEIFPEFIKRSDYTIPASHHELATMMANSNSSIRAWMSEHVIFEEGVSTSSSALFRDFWNYSAMMSMKLMKPADFKSELHQILMEGNKLKYFEGKEGLTYENIKIKPKGR